MPERPGDKPIDERVNEGTADLLNFTPDESDASVDAHSAIQRSPMRREIYFGEQTRKPHQSTRRESQQLGKLFSPLPNDVVSHPIVFELEGQEYRWTYRVPSEISSPYTRFRVFIVRNQRLELDIEKTIEAMHCSPHHNRTIAVRKHLEEEVAYENANNYVILQIMYDRILAGHDMIPGSQFWSKRPTTNQ